MVKMLRKKVKIKVTANLAKDGKIHFLGRDIAIRARRGPEVWHGPGNMQDV